MPVPDARSSRAGWRCPAPTTLVGPEPGLAQRRRHDPRRRCARSPRRRARPSPAAGSTAGARAAPPTPSGRRRSNSRHRVDVVPWSIADHVRSVGHRLELERRASPSIGGESTSRGRPPGRSVTVRRAGSPGRRRAVRPSAARRRSRRRRGRRSRRIGARDAGLARRPAPRPRPPSPARDLGERARELDRGAACAGCSGSSGDCADSRVAQRRVRSSTCPARWRAAAAARRPEGLGRVVGPEHVVDDADLPVQRTTPIRTRLAVRAASASAQFIGRERRSCRRGRSMPRCRQARPRAGTCPMSGVLLDEADVAQGAQDAVGGALRQVERRAISREAAAAGQLRRAGGGSPPPARSTGSRPGMRSSSLWQSAVTPIASTTVRQCRTTPIDLRSHSLRSVHTRSPSERLTSRRTAHGGIDMKKLHRLVGELAAEFAGTMILILFGCGVVAQVVTGGPSRSRRRPRLHRLGLGPRRHARRLRRRPDQRRPPQPGGDDRARGVQGLHLAQGRCRTRSPSRRRVRRAR